MNCTIYSQSSDAKFFPFESLLLSNAIIVDIAVDRNSSDHLDSISINTFAKKGGIKTNQKRKHNEKIKSPNKTILL